MPPTGFATCTYLVGWRTAEQAWGLIADETEWQTLLRGAAPCRPLGRPDERPCRRRAADPESFSVRLAAVHRMRVTVMVPCLPLPARTSTTRSLSTLGVRLAVGSPLSGHAGADEDVSDAPAELAHADADDSSAAYGHVCGYGDASVLAGVG